MPKGFVFWIIYLICIILYGVLSWPLNRASGAIFLIFILLALLGWSVYGPIIR